MGSTIHGEDSDNSSTNSTNSTDCHHGTPGEVARDRRGPGLGDETRLDALLGRFAGPGPLLVLCCIRIIRLISNDFSKKRPVSRGHARPQPPAASRRYGGGAEQPAPVPVGVTGHRTQRPRGQVGPPGPPQAAQPSSSLDPGGERRPIPPPLAQLVRGEGGGRGARWGVVRAARFCSYN
jgi:hypothetical protein